MFLALNVYNIWWNLLILDISLFQVHKIFVPPGMPEEELVKPHRTSGRHRGQQARGPTRVLRQLPLLRHDAPATPRPRRHPRHALSNLPDVPRHKSSKTV